MNANKPHDVVAQLIEDLAQGRRVLIPSLERPQAKAMKQLLLEVADFARQDSSVESLRQFLADKLEVEDLDAIQVVTSGYHEFSNGFIVAAGNAHVTMSGNGVLLAIGNASVIARGRTTVFGTDHSRFRLYDHTVANLSGEVQVNSYDYSSGIAEDTVRGIARNRSEWRLLGAADFDAYDNSLAYGRESSSIRAYGNSKLIGRERVRAELFDGANGWFTDESEIVLHGSSIVYAQPSARCHVRGSSARLMRMSPKGLAQAWAS